MTRIMLLMVCLMATRTFGQTLTDGLMMPDKNLCTGFVYSVDQWKNYWEGTLKRDNQNIGTLTTQRVTWMASYGIGRKVNLIAMLPYVTTNASGGTLHGQQGIQDLTIGAKYRWLEKKSDAGTFRAYAAGTFSTPATRYTPDFFPLSLGFGSTNLSGRLTMNYLLPMGLYFNLSGALTHRSNVTLDRPSYYTNNTFYETNQVWMPATVDGQVDIGYHKQALQVQVSYKQLNTLGGGDIRRQDMPFVSNQMNASVMEALVMYYVPKPKGLAIRSSASYVVAGRNVGQTTSLMAGLMYTIDFGKPTE
ncbi:MAG TPA: transporter [Cyclobacteriaceae bacterium]|nr:transporter [Cyclobacteriaceae bacterium]